uniref:Uncharacterized protein n=1 Tax=Phytophthora ramorum TaxID=164328 RepID=H3H374_PHYRM
MSHFQKTPSQSKRPPLLVHYGECKPASKVFLACMHDEEGMKKTWTGETNESRMEVEGSMATERTVQSLRCLRQRERLAKDGCYVLGLSHRELPSHWTNEQVVAFAVNRGAVDESLSTLGLTLFRYDQKNDTADAIAKIKGGAGLTVMTTGDNAMCGFNMVPGMVASSSRAILGEIASTTHAKTLVWRDADSEEEYDLPAVKHLVEQGEDVELAVPGVTFD